MKTAHAVDKRARDLLKPIRARSGMSNEIDAALLIRARERYLTSLDVKIAHLQRLHAGVTRDDLKGMAERLDPFAPPRKPISFVEIARPEREPRVVCSLPLALKATHRMAKDLIEAQTVAHPSVYRGGGRGRDQLICELRSTLTIQPDAWVVLADITNCFQSINPESIYELRLLPDRFVEAALDVRRMKFRKKDRLPTNGGPLRQEEGRSNPYPVITFSEHAGLRGLLQGSPASNSLLSVFFNDLPSRLPQGVTTFVKSDNIAVVCRSQAECSSVCQALGDYVSHHHAGSLVLRIDFRGAAREGFDFLGYRFDHFDDRWSVRHSRLNFIGAIRRFLSTCDDPQLTTNEALAELVSGFPALTDDDVERLVLMIDEAS